MRTDSRRLSGKEWTYFYRDTAEDRRRVAGHAFSNPDYGRGHLTTMSTRSLTRIIKEGFYTVVIGPLSPTAPGEGYTYRIVQNHQPLFLEDGGTFGVKEFSRYQVKQIFEQLSAKLSKIPGLNYIETLSRSGRGYVIVATFLPKNGISQGDIEHLLEKMLQ
ncbi:hypothetical protein HYX03_02510 [Candidatus Woesearchaeota archaeon]|nr:hypothetical protein [Candidatus Woesearchaeota archaeon]